MNSLDRSRPSCWCKNQSSTGLEILTLQLLWFAGVLSGQLFFKWRIANSTCSRCGLQKVIQLLWSELIDGLKRDFGTRSLASSQNYSQAPNHFRSVDTTSFRDPRLSLARGDPDEDSTTRVEVSALSDHLPIDESSTASTEASGDVRDDRPYRPVCIPIPRVCNIGFLRSTNLLKTIAWSLI